MPHTQAVLCVQHATHPSCFVCATCYTGKLFCVCNTPFTEAVLCVEYILHIKEYYPANCPFHPSIAVLVWLFCITYLLHKRFCTYTESSTALRGNLPPAPQQPMTQLDNNLRQLCRFSAGGPLAPLIVLHMLYTLRPKVSSISRCLFASVLYCVLTR